MTIEEAIKNIKDHCYFANLIPQAKEALDIAIKALEQEPCGDCISRQAVINAIKNYASMLWEKYYEQFPESTILEMIQELPSVTPQPKMGQWIFDEVLDHHYYCSECKSMGVNYWDYCPNCGCKM